MSERVSQDATIDELFANMCEAVAAWPKAETPGRVAAGPVVELSV